MKRSIQHHGRSSPGLGLVGLALGAVLAVSACGAEVDLMRELELAAKEAGVELDIPVWDLSAELEAAVGNSDNVTLAAINPDASAFVRVAGNTLAWRTVGGSVELVGFADGTFTRYFSSATDDAALVIARAEVRWDPEGAWRSTLGLQGIHQDEVIDASSLENDLGAVHARLVNAALLGSVECGLTRSLTLSARPAVRRFDYRPPLDDFTEYEGEIALLRDFAKAGKLAVATRLMLRDYENRPQAGPVGRPIYGTRLAVGQFATDLRHEFAGAGEAPWWARFRIGYLENRDNGSGYYDYDRWFADVRAALTRGAWSFEAEAGWHDTTYLVQLAGFGLTPGRRARTEWRGFARAERRLDARLSLFVEWEFIDSDSNDFFIEYRQSTALVGLRAEI